MMYKCGVGQALKAATWNRVRWIPALTLFGAAIIKISRGPQILSSGGLLGNEFIFYPTIFGELAGSVCIAFLTASASWLFAICAFGLLLLVASYAQIAGLNCNCFGASVPSWLSIGSDVSILSLCAFVRPSPALQAKSNRPVVVSGAILGLFGCAVSLATARHDDGNAPFRLLLADELINKAWPLNETVHPLLKQTETGRWLILVVRRDCEHCKELLSRHFLDSSRRRPGERTAIFVSAGRTWWFSFDAVSIDAQPQGIFEWLSGEPFVASPAVFVINEGVVVDASDGNESDILLEKLFD